MQQNGDRLRPLTEAELAEARDAIATWRAVRRVVSGSLVVALTQVAAIIAWGVTVEARFAHTSAMIEANYAADAARGQMLRDTLGTITAQQQELSHKLDKLSDTLADYRAARNGR